MRDRRCFRICGAKWRLLFKIVRTSLKSALNDFTRACSRCTTAASRCSSGVASTFLFLTGIRKKATCYRQGTASQNCYVDDDWNDDTNGTAVTT